MMNISDVLVSGILIVVILFLLVGFFDFVLPLYKKYQFDAICRNYVWLNEAGNGLSSSEVSDLKKELSAIGLSDISVDYKNRGSVSRREWIDFKVEVSYATWQFQSLFQRIKTPLVFKFDAKVIARKIVN